VKGDAEESEAERLAALEAAVQRSPTDGEAWGDLGAVYHVMGQMELAVEALRRATLFEPHRCCGHSSA